MKISSTVNYDHIRGELIDGTQTNIQIYKANSMTDRLYFINDSRAHKIWFIRGRDNFRTMITDLPQVPLLKDLSEEERFQLTLVWDYDIPMELAEAIQDFSTNRAVKLKQGETHTSVVLLEYEVQDED